MSPQVNRLLVSSSEMAQHPDRSRLFYGSVAHPTPLISQRMVPRKAFSNRLITSKRYYSLINEFMLTQPETLLRIPGYRHLQNRQLISRLEGSGNYTIVHLQGDSKPLLVSQTLKRFEDQLPHFIRISKSTMVNPSYVQQVIRQEPQVIYVQLTNGLCLLVSRRRMLETLARLGRH